MRYNSAMSETVQPDYLPAPSVGGLGASRTIAKHDVRLAARAIRNRWPISDSDRADVMRWLSETAATTDDDRSRIAACKAIIDADKLNMEQERRDLEIPDRVEVTATGAQPQNVTLNVFARIDSLSNAFIRAAGGEGEGGLPCDDTGKRVDSGQHQSVHDAAAG